MNFQRFPTLYEPLVIMFERGGEFVVEGSLDDADTVGILIGGPK